MDLPELPQERGGGGAEGGPGAERAGEFRMDHRCLLRKSLTEFFFNM